MCKMTFGRRSGCTLPSRWDKQIYLVCPVRAGPGNIGVDRGRADNGQTFLDKDGNREVKDGSGEFKQICL